MKKIIQMAVGAVASLIVAPMAMAGFTVTSTVTPIASGPNAGSFQIKFFATNDGLGGTGTKLLGVAATMTTDSHFIFRMANLDPDSTLDADILELSSQLSVDYSDGAGNNLSTRNTAPFSVVATSPNTGTAIRPLGAGAKAADFSAQKFDPLNPTSNPNVVNDPVDPNQVVSATATVNPGLTYNNTVKSFRVEGAYLGGASSPLATGVGTAGSNFAIAVVPAGTDHVTLTLTQLAGDIGSISNIPDLVVPIPEPTTVGLLGVVGAGLLARRRRNA